MVSDGGCFHIEQMQHFISQVWYVSCREFKPLYQVFIRALLYGKIYNLDLVLAVYLITAITQKTK